MAHLAVIAFFAVLSALYFWPLPLHFSTHIPGFPGDNFFFLWDQRWVQLSLARLHASPLYTDWIYYPLGVPLIFHALVPAHGLFALPLYSLGLGSVPIFNLLFLLSYVLTGYATWLLVLRLTGSRLAGLIAGLVFTFCPYKWTHAQGHLNLIYTQWIPLFLLCLLDTLSARRWRFPLFAGLFLLLQLYSDLQYSIFLLLLAAPVVLDVLLRRRAARGAWARLALVLIVALVGSLPLLLAGRRALAAEGQFFASRSVTRPQFSADLEGYLRPPVNHPVLGGFSASFSSGGERTVFLGWTAALLALLGAFRGKRKTAVWLVSALAFVLLSLGPVIHVHGRALVRNRVYELVRANLPGLESLRTPGRFGLVVTLCVAVLAGFGVASLAARLRRPRSYLLAGALGALLLFEFAIPSWIARATLPPGFARAGEMLPFGTPVFILPPRVGDGEVFFGPMDFRAQYFCLEAGLRCAGSGFASRSPRWRVAFFTQKPALRPLYRDPRQIRPPFEVPLRELETVRAGFLPTLQERLHTDHVLALSGLPAKDPRAELTASALAGLRREFELGGVALYRAPAPPRRRAPVPGDALEMWRGILAEKRRAASGRN